MAALTLHELAEIGQFVGGIASVLVIASIYFVWKQVRQQAQNSRTELITGMTTLIVSVSQVFIEHPDMRKYFHDGAVPTDREAERARAIAVTMADAMDHVAAHLGLMDHPAEEAWKRYIGDMCDRSPILKEYLQTHRDWYGPALREQSGIG